jgi:predicted alpha-1,2-mannosidase
MRIFCFIVLAAVTACSSKPVATPDDAAADAIGGDDASVDAVDAAGEVTVADEAPLAHAVNPMIGTSFGGGNVGSMYPAATRPWGLCKVGPDTQNDGGAVGALHCAGYQYVDPYIYGFSHNHLEGTGAGDYGNLAVMPFATLNADSTTRNGRNSTFSHDTEKAEAGYYAVTLDKPHVRAEMTATTRCAHHRYTFQDAPADGGVLIDMATSISKGYTGAGNVQLDAKTQTIRGQVQNIGAFSGRYQGFPVYFEARFDRPWQTAGVWTDGAIQPGVDATATTAAPSNIGAWAKFADLQKPVELQLCVSYVDAEGAKKALAAELPKFDFDGTRKAALLEWQKALGVIEIDAPSADERTLFYSSLYRVMQMPTIWSDVDGRYRGFDNQIHTADGWNYVTDLSLWDTFRTENPLIVLLWPTMARDTLRSLAAQTAQAPNGEAPQWSMGMGDTGSMIGYHSASLAADAIVKGVTDFDAGTLYDGLFAMTATPTTTFECAKDYQQFGYCTRESDSGSVSKTLEYSYDDACLATMATYLKKPDDAAMFQKRSASYKKLWDDKTQFFRARHKDTGAFTDNFFPENWSFSNDEYVEGSAWQWNFFAPHDNAGLRGLYPNDAAFVTKLDAFFQGSLDNFSFYVPSGFYFQGNEPDILSSTLFSDAGRPDLSDKWTRWIADVCYTTVPDGLVGNDDAGTLSAWYVFAAMGLMPRPGLPGYDVVAPRYDHATIHLAGGDVKIDAIGAYAKKLSGTVSWSGTELKKRWIEHDKLATGGTMQWAAAVKQ